MNGLGAVEITGIFSQLLVVLAVLFVLTVVVRMLLSRLDVWIGQSSEHWGKDLFAVLKRPLSVILWTIGLTYFGDVMLTQWEVKDTYIDMEQLRSISTVICLAWFLILYLAKIETRLREQAQSGQFLMEAGKIAAVHKLLIVLIICISAVLALDSLGVNIGALLALGGVGSIAVAFAAQDIVANFFGGLMIYINQPFTVGQWVNSPERNIEGVVENIGWYMTTIRSFDKRPIFVPNSVFSKIVLVNPSRMLHRRIREHISLRYKDIPSIRVIVKEIEQMLQEHAEITKNQSLMVYLDRFGAFSVDILIYCFTNTTKWAEWLRIKQDVLLKIADIAHRHEADFAFPTSTVEMPDGLSLNQGVIDENKNKNNLT